MVGFQPVVGVLLVVVPRRRASSSTSFGYTGARSVTISDGAVPAVVSARWKNARAAALSRLAAT